MPRPFTRDELVVLLDHYLRRTAGKPIDGRALSRRLHALPANRGRPADEAFRTPDGVMRALRRFDVYARGGNDRDSPHYRAVWDRYAHDPEALSTAVAQAEGKAPPDGVPRGTGITPGSGDVDARLRDASVTDARGRAGRSYERADTTATVAERDPFPVDPAVVERSLRSHALLQNELADTVSAAGFEPRSPDGVAVFDLAWHDGDVLWVAEVKSLTAANEERQLRLGLGQLLRYRQMLAAQAREVRAMLYVERRPRDDAWIEVCESVDVVLRWPAVDR